MKLLYKVENLRSIKSMDFVELKPITILVGKNNSGKSTFLRSIQLLRQSIETNESAPVLWKGPHTDFGNFASAVTDSDSDNVITFSFRIENFSLYSSDVGEKNIKKIEYIISIIKYKNYTSLKRIELIIHDYELNLIFEYSNHRILNCIMNDTLINGDSGIFPDINIEVDPGELFPSFNMLATDEYREKYQVTYRGSIFRLIGKIVDRVFKNKNEINGYDKFKRYIIFRLICEQLLTENDIDQEIKDTKFTVNQFYTNLRDKKDLIDELNLIYKLRLTFNAINSISTMLRRFFLGNIYLGPSRVNSERYYEVQEISTTHISPDGSNFPMFLHRLKNENQLEKFKDWLKVLLEIDIEINNSDEIFSIVIERDKNKANFKDSGYGLSQILPILAEFWIISKGDQRSLDNVQKNEDKKRNIEFRPFTIEQPEVHLHPKHQGQIIVALENALSKLNLDYSPIFIIETHSKAIIDQLGEFVENEVKNREPKIRPNDINLVLFSSENGYTSVEQSHFNYDGVLENWPYGFLR